MYVLQRFSLRWMFFWLVCLTAPISFYVHILEPCWNCKDFEAAAVHEIGHLVGLNHPDVYSSYQRTALAPMGSASWLE